MASRVAEEVRELCNTLKDVRVSVTPKNHTPSFYFQVVN